MERKIISDSELLQELSRLQKEIDLLRAEKRSQSEFPDLRLRILHEIEHSILALQDEQSTAQIALQHVADIVPDYHSSSVLITDDRKETAQILALDFAGNETILGDGNADINQDIPFGSLSIDIETLRAGKSFKIDDLNSSLTQSDIQAKMVKAGIRSYLSVPLIASREMKGILNLASSSPGVLQSNQIRIAQEIADSLAIAIQQGALRRAEQQGLREAEVMRDIMAALASAGTLNQTLEIILLNLRNVIAYDRAALYLLDDHQRYVPAERTDFNPGSKFRSHFDDDLLIAEMRTNHNVFCVADIQDDPRFSTWPDMESIRGWMGAPLTIGEEMIGFISLGSLEPQAYVEADIAVVQGFTLQISKVLEKAWLHEQSHRRTEELEVLSSLSFALDMVHGQEGTLSTIINQITSLFDAQCGTFIIPYNQDTQLRVLFSQEEHLIGLTHHSADDALWQVFLNGEIVIIRDLKGYLREKPAPLTQALLEGKRTAALLPVHAGEANFGILCFTFDEPRRISSEEINLLSSISDIAGAALQRTIELEALERQVTKRNQRLSTLYSINAVANEPIDLEFSLEKLLKIALEINHSSVGAIHLVDPDANNLKMVTQQGIPPENISSLEQLDLEDDIWTSLLFSSQPLVIADIAQDTRLPKQWRGVIMQGGNTFISTPVRAKGIPLGLLSIFRESMHNYSVEDITLLMTIASQIGASVERNRLINQVEQAAVLEERQRLARELHDSVTQLLYSQVLFASAGEKSLDHGEVQPARQFLDRIDQAALQALKEMRILVYELTPQETLSGGLLKALDRRLDAVERRAGMDASVELLGTLTLSDASQLNLFRLIQEALNNTLKHSRATSVRIKLHQQMNMLGVEIQDNGIGFNLEEQSRSGGMGLANIQERADELGAELLIKTKPGQGTCIIVTLKEIP
jgi:signal transduction histidine kinase